MGLPSHKSMASMRSAPGRSRAVRRRCAAGPGPACSGARSSMRTAVRAWDCRWRARADCRDGAGSSSCDAPGPGLQRVAQPIAHRRLRTGVATHASAQAGDGIPAWRFAPGQDQRSMVERAKRVGLPMRRAPPAALGQCGERLVQLALLRRRGQQRPHDRESQVRPLDSRRAVPSSCAIESPSRRRPPGAARRWRDQRRSPFTRAQEASSVGPIDPHTVRLRWSSTG